MANLNTWWYRFLEDHVYALPEPPPRVRTKSLEVICVGLPRSATESLQHALLTLGYDHTYHGWDIIYEQPNYAQQWVKLCRKKWFGPLDGNTTFTQADFDAVMGHSTAVTDAAGSVFAAELIEAYPDAKVVLNHRRDLDAWHRSASTTIAGVKHNWALWVLSFLSRQGFWAWHVYLDFMWSGIFRGLDNDIETGIARNGKWVYKEHCNMIRGLVHKERLLEWTVEDGWGPLCEFLGKSVPDEPFPHSNTAAGWHNHEDTIAKMYVAEAVQTLVVLLAFAVGAGAIVCKFIL